jgi:hypothetical protein
LIDRFWPRLCGNTLAVTGRAGLCVLASAIGGRLSSNTLRERHGAR